MSFITVRTPDGEEWADQEYLIRKDLISTIRLTKKVASGVENGVTIYTQNQGWQQSFWVRCTSYDAAVLLYQQIKETLQ